MLKFNNVSFNYDKSTEILDNLSFSIKKGDFVSLIGQSGGGKSTIFRLILGFEKPTYGNIEINGDYKIGFMPQKDLLFPWRTIEENLALCLEVKKLDKKTIKKKVNDILNDMNLMETKDLYPSELSGGMRQRIAFARTVLTGADILLLDEPFSALDYLTRIDFQEWIINQYMRLKKTIFFITHSVEEALLLSNRILVFENRPAKELKEIVLKNEYPRDQSMLNTPEIIELKNSLIESLNKKGVKNEN